MLLCYWSVFSSVIRKFHSRCAEQFLGSKAASCKHPQGQIAAVGSVKRVTGIIFKLVKNFDYDFFIEKSSKDLKNHQRINKRH